MLRRSALVLCLFSAVASAATISGKITDTTGAAITGSEVTLWVQGAKGYTLADTQSASSSGDYAFSSVAAGTYKVHARGSPGTNNWSDRWYDVQSPTGNGYVPEYADELVVTTTDFTGIDIKLEVNGGFDGVVTDGTSGISGMQARAEQLADYRIHHNDQTKPAPHAGGYSFRGLPPGDYRVIVHDQNANHDNLIVPGPVTVVANANGSAGSAVMNPMPVDPYEPNGTADTATQIDSTPFNLAPPQPYTVSNALIGPRNSGDTDWYCFDVQDGQRFTINAAAYIADADGGRHEDPWVDPIVALMPDDGGTTPIAEDDDNGPMSRDALLDTGILSAGHYCAAVSTYGDTTYSGMSQGSAGRYELTIKLGNRPPSVSSEVGGSPAPVPPASVTIAEGDTVTIDTNWSDPDGDALTVTYEYTDANGNVVTGGSWGTAPQTFSWTSGQTAAAGSPYMLTVTVRDAEFVRTSKVLVTVTSVNFPPAVPVQVAPDDGGMLTYSTPTLVCTESSDVDLDALQYEFEIYYGDAGTPAQTGTAFGLADGGYDGGLIAWDAGAVPEDTWASWRVRAFDGNASNGHSAWTGFWTFLVNTRNDPPPAPLLTKPTDGEEVILRRPVLSVQARPDPEGDVIGIFFQVASDSAFTQDVVSSVAVPVDTQGPDTTWTVNQDLQWGKTYYARAWATDEHGAQGPYSNVNTFSLKVNTPADQPSLGGLFGPQCSDLVLTSPPTWIDVPHVADPELEPVSVQLQIFKADDNVDSATPLFDQTKPQANNPNGIASFDLSTVTFEEDVRYRFRTRSDDGTTKSDWAECFLTVNAQPDVGPGAGGGSGGGGAGGGDGSGDAHVKKGCGCGATDASAIAVIGLLAMAAVSRKRRRVQ